MSLSVVLATFNEEENLQDCLESIKDIADEIIVVDGSSKDNTVVIAKKYGARTIVTTNPQIFHINKQKAIDLASKDWILQLDADERVTRELRDEIKNVLSLDSEEKICF
jgi:glycosyltransferase involved in cell wall biosynthesis